MPAEVLTYFLKHDDARLKLKFQIIFQCAPFLKRMKISCGIRIESVLLKEMEKILRETDIRYRILAESEEHCLILLYRQDTFVRYLGMVGIRSYLREWGYDEMGIEEMLDRLAERLEDDTHESGEFPHEIGIFLGYPIEDVKGFVRNSGKGFLFMGYWKVYSNPLKAKRIFNEFDHAKNHAVNEFLMGRSIQEIVRN